MAKKQRIVIDTGGIFFSLLAVLFIGLKLTHYIDWSWIWVLAPLWVPFLLGIGICLGVIFIKVIY